MSFLVEENPAKHRFEILVDDALAGFTAYLPRGEVLVFTHTEVDERYQGMGVGAALIQGRPKPGKTSQVSAKTTAATRTPAVRTAVRDA
ncbi:GNAT family N-acetyltransferase, partial [Micromonospora sp. NPDC003776]